MTCPSGALAKRGCRRLLLRLATALAVLPAGADPDIALFFALGQLPMYIMPAILAPLFRRMVRHRHPGEPLA